MENGLTPVVPQMNSKVALAGAAIVVIAAVARVIVGGLVVQVVVATALLAPAVTAKQGMEEVALAQTIVGTLVEEDTVFEMTNGQFNLSQS